MNIISIDPSLSCTAVIVNDKKFVYANDTTAWTKTGKLKKWFEETSHLIDFHIVSYEKSAIYSDQEIKKLSGYDAVSDKILQDIQNHLVPGAIRVGIEGYSYSSQAGPLIDLVCFGTLLRKKLITLTPEVNVFPPSTLKMLAAKLTYPPTKKGKKDEWRNFQGVAGGKFKKGEMYKCLTENATLTCPWVEFLRANDADILAATNVPKPIEDMNDAKLMYEILKADKY